MSSFDTNPKKLKEDLLNSIFTREIALPDFQRDFIWQPYQTKGLILSLSKDFPAGSLLRLESGDELVFQPRAFEGAPELDGNTPKYLILDGQQRLSSLYQALYGTGDHLYYFDFNKFKISRDVDEALFYERREKGEKKYGSLQLQAINRVLPLSEIFGGQGFYSWLDEIEDILEKESNENLHLKKEEQKEIRSIYDEYIKPIEHYQFPVVTLIEPISLEAVCTIFETLNNTGVKLSVFDLLSARYYAEKINLRSLWDSAKNNSDFFETFDLDPYYLLQVICSKVRNSVKRSDVLNLEAQDVLKNWDAAVFGMNEALGILHNECGVLIPKWLAYSTALVPMAAIFMSNRDLKGPAISNFRTRIKRWFWCATIGMAYESSPTSQTMKDINEFHAWSRNGKEPECVQNFKFDREDLVNITPRQRAVYRSLFCLVLRTPSLDFHTSKQITKSLIHDSLIDDHHIFPKGFLDKQPRFIEEFKDKVDCVLNRTLIDKETNQRIGMNPPSKYLEEIEVAVKKHNSDHDILQRILTSHHLPTSADSSLRNDQFLQFLNERAVEFEILINDAVHNG